MARKLVISVVSEGTLISTKSNLIKDKYTKKTGRPELKNSLAFLLLLRVGPPPLTICIINTFEIKSVESTKSTQNHDPQLVGLRSTVMRRNVILFCLVEGFRVDSSSSNQLLREVFKRAP